MTERFCAEVLRRAAPAVAVLWLANPDLTLHGAPLGSPAHLAALRETEAQRRCKSSRPSRVCAKPATTFCFSSAPTTDRKRSATCVDIEAWLSAHGLGDLVASQRCGGRRARHRGLALCDARGPRQAARSSRTSCAASALGRRSRHRAESSPRWAMRHSDGVVAAINMARAGTANRLRRCRLALDRRGARQTGRHRQRTAWRLRARRDQAVPDAQRQRRRTGRASAARAASSISRRPFSNFLELPAGELDGSPLAEFAPAQTAATVISTLQTRTRSFT